MEQSVIEKYIDYVNNITDRFSKDVSLISSDGSEILPSEINFALGRYMLILPALIAEKGRLKIELEKIKLDYEKWYNDCFEKTRKLMEEQKESKSIKISVKEYESKVRYDYANEYYSWQERLIEKEEEAEYINQVVSAYKAFQNILVTLAQNTRTEMASLGLVDRMNAGNKRRRVVEE